MKVRAATYALAAITNQYATIQSTDMTAILGASSVVMAPYNSATPAVTISQIKINGSGRGQDRMECHAGWYGAHRRLYR